MSLSTSQHEPIRATISLLSTHKTLWLARLALALVFIAAAVPKLNDPQMFAEQVFNYRMLSADMSAWVSLFLPPLELCTAFALLIPKYSRSAAILMLGMLVMFIVGMLQAMYRGLNIDCGCFGQAIEVSISWWLVARNVLFSSLALFIIWRSDS